MRYLTISASLIFFFIGCNQGKKYVVENSREAALRKANKIKEATVRKLIFNSNGNIFLQRIESINTYNNDGFLIQHTQKKYESTAVEPDKAPTKNKFGDIRDFLPNIEFTETDIAKGFSDTTLFLYNDNNQLIKEIRKWYDRNGKLIPEIYITNEYDNFGNKTKSCTITATRENKCFYTFFAYDETGKIRYRDDSSSSKNASLIWKGKSDNYQYDEKGNLIYDGYVKYKYDLNNNVIEEIGLKPGFFSESRKYNTKGELIQVTTVNNNDTLWTNYLQYDETGLLIEYKEKSKEEINFIFKYDYKRY